MSKKKKNVESMKNNPPKVKMTSMANIFYSQKVAPLEKEYRQAMKARNYDEAGRIYEQIERARKEYRLWLHRKQLERTN